MQLGAGDLDVIGIPQRGAAELGHLAVPDYQPVIVPEGIAQIEKAVLHLDFAALLEGALPVGGTVKSTVNHPDFLCAVEGALRVEFLILNGFHKSIPPLQRILPPDQSDGDSLAIR